MKLEVAHAFCEFSCPVANVALVIVEAIGGGHTVFVEGSSQYAVVVEIKQVDAPDLETCIGDR